MNRFPPASVVNKCEQGTHQIPKSTSKRIQANARHGQVQGRGPILLPARFSRLKEL